VIITILLGILGLGIVVFVHELGHFVVAKASGITVEAFSLGWGKVLFSRTWKGTDYRISLLPIGGYCKMKGEELFKKALSENSKSIPDEEGSLFSVAVWKRLLTYAAGPLFNFLFAVLVLAIIWYGGFTIHTFENRIILLSDYPEVFEKGPNPSDEAGLKTGDKIIALGNTPVETYSDIQRLIAQSPKENLPITFERGGQRFQSTITPELDRDTGAGRIGVAAWIEPVVASLVEGGSGSTASLREGDRIITANGEEIHHSLDLYALLAGQPSTLELRFLRGGMEQTTVLIPFYDEKGGTDLGIGFQGIRRRTPKLNPFQALAQGAREAVETFTLTIKGIVLLFSGVDIGKAVSGPVRITYMVGEVASQGFSEGIGTGFLALFRFLSFLSVALCFGNLLPIPALDGGLIVLSLVEMLKGTSVSPKTFYRYQTVGFLIILAILFLTTFSDISYFFSG
jgi:regulator of sigma E protease